ncbi:hypothetical protein EVAR_45911_1, partial [Eumeta japonica]
ERRAAQKLREIDALGRAGRPVRLPARFGFEKKSVKCETEPGNEDFVRSTSMIIHSYTKKSVLNIIDHIVLCEIGRRGRASPGISRRPAARLSPFPARAAAYALAGHAFPTHESAGGRRKSGALSVTGSDPGLDGKKIIIGGHESIQNMNRERYFCVYYKSKTKRTNESGTGVKTKTKIARAPIGIESDIGIDIGVGKRTGIRTEGNRNKNQNCITVNARVTMVLSHAPAEQKIFEEGIVGVKSASLSCKVGELTARAHATSDYRAEKCRDLLMETVKYYILQLKTQVSDF